MAKDRKNKEATESAESDQTVAQQNGAETQQQGDQTQQNAGTNDTGGEGETAGDHSEYPVEAEAAPQPAQPARGTHEAADAFLSPLPDVPNGRLGAKFLDRALTPGASG